MDKINGLLNGKSNIKEQYYHLIYDEEEYILQKICNGKPKDKKEGYKAEFFRTLKKTEDVGWKCADCIHHKKCKIKNENHKFFWIPLKLERLKEENPENKIRKITKQKALAYLI